jgi:hypothetical protein
MHEMFLLGRDGGEVLSDKATGMQEISNYLMGSFKDTIGLRLFDSGQFGSYSI